MPEAFHLLPMPQRMTRLSGSYQAVPDRTISLDSSNPQRLLFVGKMLQRAVSTAFNTQWTLIAGNAKGSALGAQIHLEPAQMPKPESYCLTVKPDGLRIVARDPAGAFYAVMTLRQLLRQFPDGTIPCLRIEDWPDYANRGVLLDISRDKVPTMVTLFMLVDMLAEWKINQFQIYMEHTFAYQRHPEVWAAASPLTGEQILLLDAYCRERFIELVPSQNSFGHMTRWLKHPRYAHLAETQGSFQYPWGEWDTGPFSLCPLDPGSIQLMSELYDELLPHFTSKQINVGCDEVFELGQAGTRSQKVCEERGIGRVYLDYVGQLSRVIRQHNHAMQFWADVVTRHHPELLPDLPDNSIAMEWGYEADYPFADNTRTLAEAGTPFYVCPGTSSWSTISGRTDNAIANLRQAAQTGLVHDAVGLLITDWGDRGHWQALPISYLGFACGAAVGWAYNANLDINLATVLSLHVFEDQAGIMGQLAYDLGNAYQETGIHVPNSSALFSLLMHPHKTFEEAWIAGLNRQGLERTADYISRAIARLGQVHMRRADSAQIVGEFRQTADLLLHACRVGIARLQTGDNSVPAIPADKRRELAAEWTNFKEEHRRLWLVRNRPGGLDDSAARFDQLLQLYTA